MYIYPIGYKTQLLFQPILLFEVTGDEFDYWATKWAERVAEFYNL
mgnify:CR=1 FL=1